jgi:hypothetical protein
MILINDNFVVSEFFLGKKKEKDERDREKKKGTNTILIQLG